MRPYVETGRHAVKLAMHDKKKGCRTQKDMVRVIPNSGPLCRNVEIGALKGPNVYQLPRAGFLARFPASHTIPDDHCRPCTGL